MKFISKIILTLLISFTLFTSCDVVDALKDYPVNIPLSVTFSASGSSTSIVESKEFCINNDSTYQAYSDKVKKVTFVEVAFRTLSFSPADLRGTIVVTLNDAAGNLLFSETIENASPGDYVNTPYVISLDAAEIQAIDAYLESALSKNQTLCFTAGLNVSITSGSQTNSLEGAIDIVFEAMTEL